ncbi:hypothetical protein HaLaN_08907, partial [Haematococcus lacustris]
MSISSRSEPGGLKCDCTSGSMPSAVRSLVPLLTTRPIDSANATNATGTGALCCEYLHEGYQPHVGDS